VVFVAPPWIYVAVRAVCHIPGRGEALVTNSYNFTFMDAAAGGRSGGQPPLRRVSPQTLAEGLEYMAAHREHTAGLGAVFSEHTGLGAGLDP
jgi:hypothetical protein